MATSLYLRAAALGLATGARSQAGITVLAWTAPAPSALSRLDPLLGRRPGRVSRFLAGKWAKTSTALALSGEIVGDKLPAAPSRSDPAPLAARLVLGALSGYVLAERIGGNRIVSGLFGAAGAAVTTVLGPKYRALAAARIPALGPLPRDLPGAVFEDGVALGLGLLAAK